MQILTEIKKYVIILYQKSGNIRKKEGDAMTKLIRKLRGLLQIIFGRSAMVIFSLLTQLVFFFVIIEKLSDYSGVVYAFLILLSAITIIHILNEDTNANFKMAWIIPVLVIPVFGTMLYIFINVQIETKKMQKNTTKIESQIKPLLRQNETIADELKSESKGEKGLASYLKNTGDFLVYKDNDVEFFPLGEDKFEEMVKQLRQAKHFIFMEYFIVAKGYMLDTILDILKEKAAEGVEVRFMYDGTCSIALLPWGYYKELAHYGIKSRPFSQIRPVLSTVQNNRDHRKILIVDGKAAFTGGINIADEYINKIERFGHWKDTAVMVKGPAVKSFTYMFLKMWHLAGGKDNIPKEDLDEYVTDYTGEKCMFPVDKENEKLRSGGYVIPYCGGSFDSDWICRQVYIDILNRADKYVHIMTPYLILDDEMISALSYCAKRGVETIIIMPHIPDKLYAYTLSRTYYRQLLENGVKIYEYTPGFVHAKLFVSDDIRASVGTANLDFRSLYLHFECSTYMYKNDAVSDIENDYQYTLKKCEEVTLDNLGDYPWIKTMLGKVLRLIAPLM